jgi:hypothetical protein
LGKTFLRRGRKGAAEEISGRADKNNNRDWTEDRPWAFQRRFVADAVVSSSREFGVFFQKTIWLFCFCFFFNFVWCKLMLRWKSFEESVVAMGLVGVGGGTSMAGERQLTHQASGALC